MLQEYQIKPQEVLAALRENVLFAGMNDEQFSSISNHTEIIKKQADQMVFVQGAQSDFFYFVYHGAVKIYRGTLKGDEKIVDVIFSGHTFAEGIMFNHIPRYPVSSTAIQQTVMVRIKSAAYIELLKSDAELCLNMLGRLSIRLHWMVGELDKQSLRNASYRVVDYMLSQVPKTETDEFTLSLGIAKRDIASQLSIKPETLSRSLKSLENRNFIVVHEKNILIKDVSLLRSMIKAESL